MLPKCHPYKVEVPSPMFFLFVCFI
uniref:Uncharacterized protein n=1 Tax=Anguilla anguilla TaxID=7936 RepID=A0A0E9VPU0_ANGAN